MSTEPIPIDRVCRVYWGHSGCDLERGHEGKHRNHRGEIDGESAFLFGEDLTADEVRQRDELW